MGKEEEARRRGEEEEGGAGRAGGVGRGGGARGRRLSFCVCVPVCVCHFKVARERPEERGTEPGAMPR